MEVTACNIETDISILLSLSRVFAMFQMSLLYHEHNEDVVKAIAVQCRNCHRKTGLHLKDKSVEEIITPFLLKSVLQNVGLSWITSSNKQTKY